jgi:hypothetical protein
VFTKVSELIEPATGQWDEQILKDIFCSQDVEIICAVPVHEDVEDSWA